MSSEFGAWKEPIVRPHRLPKLTMRAHRSRSLRKRIYGNSINCLKEVVNCNVCSNKLEISSARVICVAGNRIGIITR